MIDFARYCITFHGQVKILPWRIWTCHRPQTSCACAVSDPFHVSAAPPTLCCETASTMTMLLQSTYFNTISASPSLYKPRSVNEWEADKSKPEICRKSLAQRTTWSQGSVTHDKPSLDDNCWVGSTSKLHPRLNPTCTEIVSWPKFRSQTSDTMDRWSRRGVMS